MDPFVHCVGRCHGFDSRQPLPERGDGLRPLRSVLVPTHTHVRIGRDSRNCAVDTGRERWQVWTATGIGRHDAGSFPLPPLLGLHPEGYSALHPDHSM